MIPLTGKPLPFLSYGGSSIVSCLLLVGFVASVSLHSALPETAYDRSRRSFSTEGGEVNSFRDEYALVGEATPRSARPAGAPRASRWSQARVPVVRYVRAAGTRR
jgi:cell division protein FtsW